MFQGFTEGIIGCLYGGGGSAPVEEYLTIKETAQRLKLSPKTIRNKIASGVFKRGEHYFRAPSLGTRFKWSAIVEWLEKSGESGKKSGRTAGIPMARGYTLGHPEA
jgi:Helix-turn-helix domain